MSSFSSPRLIRLADIAQSVSGKIVGPGDLTVSGLAGLAEAGSRDLAYVATDRLVKDALASRAAAFVVSRHIPELKRPQVLVSHPAYAFARIAQRFFTDPYRARGISDQASRGTGVEIGADVSIWPFVTLGDGAKIGARATLYPGVYIGDHATVGNDTTLYPNVVVREGCVIGSRVIIHSGTVIGSDGFGYVQHEGRHHKIPQLGIVAIEDDVEIGANVAVDRATFGRTVIQRGSKIDNLVQIAHNAFIGEDCIVVAQVGIAGSTTLGRHVMVGGQAGLADHLEVGDRVMIAARSGVNRSLGPDQIVSGAPVMPHEVAIKAHAVIPRLPELRQQLRTLEERMRALEGKSKKAKGKRQK
ncbi:MAG: UDP-3-O-(3-hydroxymyristoyl)glucosamine N-acyltransferase [Nitrospiraceae bacterium]